MADDGGVLGNLPRSRPGKRSEKRASAGSPSGAAGRRARPQQRPVPPAAHRPNDPVGDVIRGAVKATGTGVRIARTVAEEVFRRVPRP